MKYKVGDKFSYNSENDVVIVAITSDGRYIILRDEERLIGDGSFGDVKVEEICKEKDLNDLEKEPSARWRAKLKGYYWFIKDDGEIACNVDDRLAKDSQRYQFGNYFETKEIAENIKHSFTETVNKLQF